MRDYEPQPLLMGQNTPLVAPATERVKHDYEQRDDGLGRPTRSGPPCNGTDWESCPIRFVDGKDVGRTVAWLQSSRSEDPVPVRLSEIGAVVLRNVHGTLRREFAQVERVVSLMADSFPWDEVESFAIALQEQGFRLLPCPQPEGGWSVISSRCVQPRRVSRIMRWAGWSARPWPATAPYQPLWMGA